MPGGKTPGPSIKHPRIYEALRRQGYSKAKAAAISNSQTLGGARRTAKTTKHPGSKRRRRGRR